MTTRDYSGFDRTPSTLSLVLLSEGFVCLVLFGAVAAIVAGLWP